MQHTPFFTNVDLGIPKPLDLEGYKASFGEALGASFSAALEANPMSILTRNQKMAGLDGLDLGDSQTPLDAREIIDADEFAADYKASALPPEDQARQIREAGLEGQLKPVPGLRQEALDILVDNKRMENALAAMNPGLGASLLGGLAAGFLDPVNLASAFVPVISEARMMSLMQAARGMGQRAAIRAGVGAASGVLGAAMLEPMIYLGQQEIQADYTLANSLQNLVFGAIMGGSMHAGIGIFAEWRRARKHKPQPWEYVPPDFASEEWKKAHADDLYRYMTEAKPDADPAKIRAEADAAAAQFDARARNWAYHEKKTVKEFYDQWRPEYRTWQDDSIWREAMPPEFRGNVADYDGSDLGWIGRQYEGLRTLNADAMSLPEFLDNLALWEERFPDQYDYAGIRQRIEDARGGRVAGSEMLYHLDDSGNAVTNSETNPRIAKVVEIDPSILTHEDGMPVNLLSREDMFKWLRNNLQGKKIQIHNDGTIVKFIREPLNASLKRRGLTHSQAYAGLDNIIENALFDRFENADARHAGKVKGQNIYYAAAKIGAEYYALKIKIDIPNKKGWNAYKDHKISEIEIAPSLYRDSRVSPNAAQNESAINGISLEILKGDVKPSRIENNNLLQTAPSRIGRQTEILGSSSREIARYELRELDDVIPYPDPESNFRRRPDRPEKGALPEATHVEEPASFNDPDALLPPELQENPRETARGSVTFRDEDRPLVTFFQSANFTTAPHELFHVFRREMERTALAADGSLHAREQWKRLCDFVGAKPGEKWTGAMEEKFADAGLRYLSEGRAPSPSLQGLFERLKAWFMELFQRAEDIGVEISPEMRKAFDEMFAVPFETADRNFRRAMGDLHAREIERDFADPDAIGKPLSPDDLRLLETADTLRQAQDLMQEAQARAAEAAARLERNNPELRSMIEETNAELAEIDREIINVDNRDELRRQAVERLANGG